jgi:hypothetical protein
MIWGVVVHTEDGEGVGFGVEASVFGGFVAQVVDLALDLGHVSGVSGPIGQGPGGGAARPAGGELAGDVLQGGPVRVDGGCVMDPLDWTLFKPLRGRLRGPVEFERSARRAQDQSL